MWERIITSIMIKRSVKYFVAFLISSVFIVPSVAQIVLSGPYMIEPGVEEITIRWEMAEKGAYQIEYGTDTTRVFKKALDYREGKHNAYLYEANLSALKESSTYFYRLISDNNRWYEFRTSGKKQKRFTFVAMGDSRSNPDIFAKIMEGTGSKNPDFVISMGDLVETGGDYEQWSAQYFSVVKGFVETTPLVSTLGDHETNGDNGELFRYFLRRDEPTDKQWFSFDYGNSHFISLDYRHPEKREMIDWFVKDMTNSDKEWNFVYMHRGAYNFGGHRTDWGRGIWPELFSKHQVDIVFAGHSHLYERFYPVRSGDEANVVTYVTTGGAGAGLYQSVPNESLIAVTESVNHFLTIQIDDNTLQMKATRMDGSLLDEMEIVKRKKGYNEAYEEQVIPSGLLNTITSFNSYLSRWINNIPHQSRKVDYRFDLKSDVDEDIPFSIELEEHSAECFVLRELSDTLYAGETKEVTCTFTRKKPVTISPWGSLTPELRFMIMYEFNAVRDTIIGKAIPYYPYE